MQGLRNSLKSVYDTNNRFHLRFEFQVGSKRSSDIKVAFNFFFRKFYAAQKNIPNQYSKQKNYSGLEHFFEPYQNF